jgi:ADP-heptose:LPS heptosyltransferase
MKRVILCRAFGDFIIALNAALHSKQPHQFQLVASSHLKPLYDAIPTNYLNAAVSIQFVEWGIKGSLLRAFTNRFFFHPNTIHELLSIKRWIKKQAPNHAQWVLEQNKRKWLIELATQTKFDCIASQGNIYEAYQHFFDAKALTIALPTKQSLNVLILPTSRQTFKDIPNEVVADLMQSLPLQGHKVNAAYFKAIPDRVVKPILSAGVNPNDKILAYHSFTELIQLILAADYIFAPDSLTAHLAYFFQKPHTILHSPRAIPQFLTPFVIANHCFYSFENSSSFVNIAHG